MASDNDSVAYSHLFFAVPELLLDEEVLKYLRRKGLIGDVEMQLVQELMKDAKRVKRLIEKTKGRSVMERIMAIAPEALSVSTVNFLRGQDLITKKQAHILRLALRGTGILTSGSKSADRYEIVMRLKKLLGLSMSEEAIALLRTIDFLTVEEANVLRAMVNGGSWTLDSARKARKVKSLVDMLALSGQFVDARLLRAMKLTGIINARTANAILEAVSYGESLWTVWEGARRADGLAARMAYVASGSFSWEGLSFLESLGIINDRQRVLLKVAVTMSQAYNRELMEMMTERRFRVVPGERPIVTFARASKQTESRLLRLLAEAASDARKEAMKMHGLSAAQRNVQARALHEAMRQVWDGVGYISIAGEREVAEAALQAQEMLSASYRKFLGEQADLMIKFQARSGLDSYISRQENTQKLSKVVYGNWNLWNGKIDKEIDKALLRGASAKEIGDIVSKFINPNVPGGVKYAAQRIGRTELANAFHQTTIRSTREMPWVRGYKWNLSGSHTRPDICNEYADDDHDGLGAGVFKKANVPGKPHPQCLCYLTVVQPTDAEFIAAFKKGRYDRYLDTIVGDSDASLTYTQRLANQAAATATTAATQVAITQIVRAALKNR